MVIIKQTAIKKYTYWILILFSFSNLVTKPFLTKLLLITTLYKAPIIAGEIIIAAAVSQTAPGATNNNKKFQKVENIPSKPFIISS